MADTFHIGAAIDGAGTHPAAWRLATTAPGDLFTATHHARAARLAERGTLDFITLDDALSAPDGREFPGRPDALLTLAALAPLTTRVGLVPTVTTTHTEPFHISKAVASLDYASLGRAGWQVAVSRSEADARLIGRRPVAADTALWDEASSVADVVTRLWDSWEDGAEIRDTATGRFIDRDRLHYVDYSGPGWTVRGPSITPRPPQGHPVVFVRAGSGPQLRAAAARADVVPLSAANPAEGRRQRTVIREAVEREGRNPDLVTVLADLDVLLDRDPLLAAERRDRLDALAAPRPVRPLPSFTGSPEQLAATLLEWADAVDGFTIRPALLPDDLALFVSDTVPLLREAGAFRPEYSARTLRGHLGLPRPANRYAPA